MVKPASGFGSFSSAAVELPAIGQVRDWTRTRFSLQPEDAVLVSELECAVPGCPPLETVVAFWTADATRHHFKIFKPVAEIVEDDLPYAWLKQSLAFIEGEGCDCC
jgi:hypothetical protein